MNFGIKEISNTNTIKTITNNTTTTTTPITATTTTDSTTGVTATITELAAAPFPTNLNSNNYTTNLPKSFTTPQNCLEILTSIQNKSVSCDTASSSSSSNATIAPTETSNSVQILNSESSLNSYMDGNEENNEELNICYHLERKKSLPDLKKQINATIPDSCTNIENSVITTLSSISNSITDTVNILKSENVTAESVSNRTEDPLSLLNESNSTASDCYITDGSELDVKENNLRCNDSKISINLNSTSILRCDEDSLSKSSENSGDLLRANFSPDCVDKSRNVSRLSERAKKKSWYNVLYPNYKSRSQDFKKLFKEVPNDERLIVDYSCALYRDLLIQGRLYVSQNYVCFHANILGWETCLNVKWKDVTSITKEKTALVIPNAISICTPKEKYFFSSFTTRDKTFLILFRVWQNTLMNKPMLAQEVWQLVHNYYGDELGLTTDDEDYIDPSREENHRDDSGGSILDFESAIDDANSLSLYKDVVETSNSNIYQIVDSSSGNSASNNNSENNSASSSGGSRTSHLKKIKTMKSNAKELTLISAKPDESSTSISQANAASAVGGSSGSGNVGTGSSGSGASGLHVTRESKQNSSTYDSKRKVSKNNRQRDESASKISENFPTDISDSSDSEENSIPFVSTTECNSLHEGRQLVHTILPINIETLFNFLFSKSKFLLDFHTMRKSTDLVFGDWITNEDGQKTRTVNVTVQLAASVGPKTSKVTEHQSMRDCTKPGELYSIDINSVNAGIPYADSFSVLMHYCLVKTVDDHTMLSVHAQIKYKKSIWGVVKGFIEKNTWAGLEDFYTSLLHSLQSETCIPPAKGKGRRPRRGTAAQIRPLEEIPILQTKPEPMEQFGAAQTLATRHRADSPVVVAETTTTKYRWLSLFVLVLLCFLIFVNVILLLKLWKLEERIDEDMSSRARMPNLSALKQLPNNHEDWLELLRQQEILHETELKKWHTVLQTAIELLKKTERTLAELMFH